METELYGEIEWVHSNGEELQTNEVSGRHVQCELDLIRHSRCENSSHISIKWF